MHKKKTLFTDGPIAAQKIADMIKAHESKTNAGAHDIFLGQVRADEINGNKVSAIEYSAYIQMAEDKYNDLREKVFEAYPVICMHAMHSIGTVRSGEISLFVMTSAAHRDAARDACKMMVDLIKSELPVWGKEVLENGDYVWKENKS